MEYDHSVKKLSNPVDYGEKTTDISPGSLSSDKATW